MSPPDPRDPRRRTRYPGTRDELVERPDALGTYRTQHTTWRDAERRQITLVGTGRPPAADAPDRDGAAYVLSAAFPHRSLASWEEVVEQDDELWRRIDAKPWPPVKAAACHDARREWVEPSVLVSGVPEPAVLDLARQVGAPALVRWAGRSLTVLDPDGAQLGEPQGWVLGPARTGCPMLRAPEPDERCAVVGGPFGSQAISAATAWTLHRERLVTMLGCTTCLDGREAVGGPPGGPILLRRIESPSRWHTAAHLLDRAER